MYGLTATCALLCADVQHIEERPLFVRSSRCAVCQMEFEPGDEVLTLPCSHFYHPNCIGEWLKDRKVRAASQLHYAMACLQCAK